MIRIAFLLFCIGVLSQCSPKQELPEGVLPREKMIAVLLDFQLAEAAVAEMRNEQGDVEYYTQLYYQSVLQIHNITPEQFRLSVAWYKDHMEDMEKVYEEVLTRLSALQGEVKTKK